MIRRFLLPFVPVLLTLAASPSSAGEADVVGVEMRRTGPDAFAFDVTVRHADEGWDHYADRFEIVAPDGTVLGVRTLAHPHVSEQPFTRSSADIAIPAGVDFVIVRAHDSVHGLGGREMILDLPR